VFWLTKTYSLLVLLSASNMGICTEFTEIGQEIHKVQIKAHSRPYVKNDCHRVDFHNNHIFQTSWEERHFRWWNIAKQLKQFVRCISGYVLRTIQIRLSRRKVIHSAYVLGVGSSTDIRTIFQAVTWLQPVHPCNLRVAGKAFWRKILWYVLRISTASSQ